MSTTKSKIKVILVDDHILVRDALSNLINNFSGFQVIYRADHGRQLVDHLTLSNSPIPDIILLDINMPQMDGFETAKWLQENRPDIRIVVLTMYDSEIALIRFLQTGARGFLKKDIHPNELQLALQTIYHEGYYYSHHTTGKLASHLAQGRDGRHSLDTLIFSDKELQFLRLACTDFAYKEIAAKMEMTPRNIDNYRDALFEKLGVKSRVGLAIYSVKNGIVAI